MLECLTLSQIMASKMEVASQHCDTAQCPRCQLGIALNRARSDQSQIVGFVI